jgi:hypothetical protein
MWRQTASTMMSALGDWGRVGKASCDWKRATACFWGVSLLREALTGTVYTCIKPRERKLHEYEVGIQFYLAAIYKKTPYVLVSPVTVSTWHACDHCGEVPASPELPVIRRSQPP